MLRGLAQQSIWVLRLYYRSSNEARPQKELILTIVSFIADSLFPTCNVQSIVAQYQFNILTLTVIHDDGVVSECAAMP